MCQYFLKPFETFGGDINVKVGLSNYATKTDLKNVSPVDVSSFALKSNLVSLKTEVDKLDIDQLVLKLIMLILQILLKKTIMKMMDQILLIKSIK